MLQEAYAAEVMRVKELDDEHRGCSSRLKALEDELDNCLEKLRLSQEDVIKHSKATDEVQREFDEFAKKASEVNAKYAEDTKEIIIERMMRTRAEMMLEYKRGEWESWEVDETIKEYNEKYPDKALALVAADESEHQPSKDEIPDDVEDDIQEDVHDEPGDDVQDGGEDEQ